MAAKNPIIPANYIGQRLGRLTITGVIPRSGRKPIRFTYDCACGAQGSAITYSVLKGTTQSCGCLANELSAVRQYKHGMKRTPEQRAYQDMMRRCYDPKRRGYKDYGGRGVLDIIQTAQSGNGG